MGERDREGGRDAGREGGRGKYIQGGEEKESGRRYIEGEISM